MTNLKWNQNIEFLSSSTGKTQNRNSSPVENYAIKWAKRELGEKKNGH